jgi:ADP-ribose pyrophosphatase
MNSKSTKEWTLASRETVFKGYYQVDKLRFHHSLFNGGTSELIDREMFVRGNVAAVLAYDPKSDSIALVEQFRIGAMNQPDNPWLLEVIAGMIEKGEEPEEVAIRESKEEAGLNLTEVQLIRRYLASPGCTPEEVFIYYAETDLSQVQGVHGLEAEGEDIQVHVMSADDAIQMLDEGIIKNSISIIALQWFQYQRLLKQVESSA